MEEEIDNSNEMTLNPWISMWLQPRATIQQIIDDNPARSVLLLSAIVGIGSVLDRASMKSTGDQLGLAAILAIAIFVGPIGGVLSLYIGSALLRWTGGWIEGKGSSENIRAAYAWSGVPLIWAMILWVPQLILFQEELFTTATPRMDENTSMAFLMIGFALVEITIAIWSGVVFLKSLGQVQGFSAWRALGNMMLATMVVLVPIVIIAILIVIVVAFAQG